MRNADYANRPGYDPDGYPIKSVQDAACTLTRLSNTTAETVITGAPARLLGVVADSGNLGMLTLRDAAAAGGSNVKGVVDAGKDHDYHSAAFGSGITAQLSGATDDVAILWRPA